MLLVHAVEEGTARGGVIGLLALVTVVAAFIGTLIIVGALSWLDFRNEECDLIDEIVGTRLPQTPAPRQLPSLV
ncbi:hypothetical protein ACFWP5_38640 [Streptomyces sp. NPDC058469]|uniref:hypothetical protein n=1 Tax=Streptomyces sp. NPDC058469 TaxID=3346514 RepID=UPI0036544410